MVISLSDRCFSEIRINEEEKERMKNLPEWARKSHQSTVEELERMRHDPAAVGDKENFSSLAAEYEFSDSDIGEKIELLGDNYDSFRQIRRDGDSFYRSFLFSYLELLAKHRLLDVAGELHRVLSILEKHEQMNAALGGRRDTFNDLLQEFKCVLVSVICGPSSEKHLRGFLDEQNALIGIILLRLITSVEIHTRIVHYRPMIVAFNYAGIKEPWRMNHCDHAGDLLKQFVVEKANVSNILTDLIRAVALSNALDVPVQVVELDAPPHGAITEGLPVHMVNCSSSRHGRDAGGADYGVTLRTSKPPAPFSDMKGLAAALDNDNDDGNDRRSSSSSSSECTRGPSVELMYWRGHYGVLYPKRGCSSSSSSSTTSKVYCTPPESPPSTFDSDQ